MRVFRFLVLQRGRGICPLICRPGVVAAAITAPGLGVGAWWQLVSFSGTGEPQLAGGAPGPQSDLGGLSGGSAPRGRWLAAYAGPAGVRAGQGMILRATAAATTTRREDCGRSPAG